MNNKNQYQEEFMSLVNENYKMIYKICSMYTSNKNDTDDIFQEVLIALWRSLPSFSGKSQLSTWIYRVALNTCITFSSQNNRRLRKTTSLTHNVPEIASNKIREMYLDLSNILDHFSDVDKAIVILLLEDRSYAEIAEIMGYKNSNNIAARIHRIKNKLKQY